MLLYAFAFASLLVVGGLLFAVKKWTKIDNNLVRKIVTLVLVALFAVRYMSYKEVQLLGGSERIFDFTVAGAGPSNFAILNWLGNIGIWFEIAAFLMIALEPFFDSKVTKFIAMYVGAPLMVISFGLMPLSFQMMRGNLDISLTFVLYGLEVGGLLGLYATKWLNNWNTKFYKPTIIKGLIATAIFIIATMPTFVPQSFFGFAPASWHVKELETAHRVFIYTIILIPPFILYFFLRDQSQSFIRYSLLYITLGVMINFVAFTKYDAIFEPWRWPIHLCNTVLFVLPICFIFKPKRLFYFTYFINVFGALFAILMPNTDYNENLLNPDIWRFWFNHGIAFWMPLLAVALKVYEKPKLKQYFYSSIWFAAYFVFAMSLNLIFDACEGTTYEFLGTHTVSATDFFFLRSTFITDKLGQFGDKVYDIVYEVNIPGIANPIKFRPAFQVPYFVIYVLLGFGMWFVYLLFFKIAESHKELQLALHDIKVEKLALESRLEGRSPKEPMNKDAGISYRLVNFSKKYAGRKVYAVKNANLEVKGGEIFGFLGPNGAGKSTIIKSTVGIQPISEGNIEVCGYDCATQPIEAKSLIGFVPDHYALYEKLSGREYLNYIADIYKVDKKERDERLAKYIKLFELEHQIDNKIKTYSHGMKQKITIMAALVHNPKLWILDEPLTGLDPQSIYQVKQCMIEHAKAGNIVFFSSHIIDIVEKLCSRIAIIKKGQILCVEKTADVEKKHGSLETFYLDMIGDTVTERNSDEK